MPTRSLLCIYRSFVVLPATPDKGCTARAWGGVGTIACVIRSWGCRVLGCDVGVPQE